MNRGLALTTPLIVAAMFAAACSGGSDDATGEVPTKVLGESTPDYAADAAQWDGAETDWGVPDAVPDVPTGSQGYSRYVYSFNDEGVVVPILVEGAPRPADQVPGPRTSLFIQRLAGTRREWR